MDNSVDPRAAAATADTKLARAKNHRRNGVKWLVFGVVFFVAALLYFYFSVELRMSNALALLASYALLYVAPVIAAAGLVRLTVGILLVSKYRAGSVAETNATLHTH